MPLLEPKFDEVQASIPIIDGEDIEVILGEPRGFYYRSKGGIDVFGLDFPIKLAGTIGPDGELDMTGEGQTLSKLRMYMHGDSDGLKSMNKQFLMAVHGYKRGEAGESLFNEEVLPDADFSFGYPDDPDDEEEGFTIGQSYQEMVGKNVRVRAELDIYHPPDGGEARRNQDYKNWSPVP